MHTRTTLQDQIFSTSSFSYRNSFSFFAEISSRYPLFIPFHEEISHIHLTLIHDVKDMSGISQIYQSEIIYLTDISDLICPCRTLLSLFSSILTCWMTPQTSLLISAGMPLSCFSRAICGRGTGCFRKESVTRTARTTSEMNWCATLNLQHLRAPGPAAVPGSDPMEIQGVPKFY